MDFKRLNIRDGVVMGHQFEIAELVQEYMNDNIMQLINALFDQKGVLSPHTDELQPSIAPTNQDGVMRIKVEPGFAICNKGILRVSDTVAREFKLNTYLDDQIIQLGGVTKESLTVDEPYLNLKYTEEKDTPVELVPYGNGEVDLRIKPSYELKFEDSAIGISDGVPIARVNPAGRSITDLRDQNPAKIRADRSLLYDMVDPALVSDIETLFSRDNFVADIENLLDNKQLQGEHIVTRLKDAVDPFFVRTSYEPALRMELRDLNGIQAEKEVEPNPEFQVVVEWNIYGVTATKVASSTFELDTQYDLTNIDYTGYDKPLFLRFQDTLYEITNIPGAKRVETASDPSVGTQSSVDTSKDEAMQAGSSDANAALTNGAEKFNVSAEPGLTWHRKGKGRTDVALDSGAREPMAEMMLEPGTWRVTIESTGDNSRSVVSTNLEVPTLDAPAEPDSVNLTGEQRSPANTGDEDASNFDPTVDTGVEANPFKNLDTDEQGRPLVNQGDIDRYLSEVQQELNRIQSQEVALSLEITPAVQNRNTARKAMTIGYDVEIEMLTGEGWQTQKEMKVNRDTNELLRELTWRDLVSNRYRGAVSEQSDLTQLSFHMDRLDVQTDSGRPIRENDIVYVENDTDSSKNGYWRYEPKMRDDTADGLTDSNGNAIATYPYGNSAGYWVQVDVERGSFQPETKVIDIPNMSGGADYRAHVRPIAEDGQSGAKITDNTEELREAYNAELGKDFHKEIGDIYNEYKKILGQVSPERFNEFLEEKVEEVRGIIDQAAQYGTPPEVEGPFRIAQQPGTVRFSGNNLAKVQQIYMRFTPPGNTDEQQVRQSARYRYITGAGNPQIAIQNLPDISDLSDKAPPVVTLQFSGGAAGSDVFVVRYEKELPTVTGPSVANFKEERVVDIIEEVEYGNTVSYWRFDWDYNGEPKPFGPFPKRWPDEKSWNEKSYIFDEGWEVYDAPNLEVDLLTENGDRYIPDWDSSVSYQQDALAEYNGQVYRATTSVSSGQSSPDSNADWTSKSLPTTKRREVEQEITARGLSFNTRNMKSDDILDVRVREMPSGSLVPQIPDERWEKWRQYNNKAHYFKLSYTNTDITIDVPSSSINMWIDKNFELEVIHYGSELVGGLEDGKGYVLEDRGESDTRPPNPDPGHFYADTSDGNVYLYTKNGSWQEAEDIESTRHTFTIKRDSSDDVKSSKSVDVRMFAEDLTNGDDMSEEKTDDQIIAFHTPSKSGSRVQPITESLKVAEDLELDGRIVAYADNNTSSGNKMVMDEWRIDTHDLSNSDARVRSDGFKALDGRITQSSFGRNTVKSLIPVPDATTDKVKAKATYKAEQTYSGSIARYETNSTGEVERAVVTVNSTDYLVDYNGEINRSTGTDIDLDGIITSYQIDWSGNTYDVIRAVNVSYPNDTADNLYADGPSFAKLTESDGSITLTFETTDSADSLTSTFASGSSTLNKSESNYTDNGKLKLDVTLDWEDFFTKVRDRLYERNDAQGRTKTDVPSYQETEVYDFRRQSLRVEPVRLKVEADRGGNLEFHYCTIQVTQSG